MQPWLYRTIWWIVFIAAAAIRLWNLGAESFWMDEIFSAQVVAHPWGKILDNIPSDKPPLDYFLQRLASPLGEPEFAHRLPAALAGILAILGIFVWARQLGGDRIALVAFLLAAFNPFLIEYAREARPYSLSLALLAWQQVAFVGWWRELNRAPLNPDMTLNWWLVYLMLSVLALYTLYVTVLVLALHLVFAIILFFMPNARPGRGLIMQAAPFAGVSVVMALCALAAVPLLGRVQVAPPAAYHWRFLGWDPRLLLDAFAAHFVFPPLPPVAMILAAAILTGFALAGLAILWCRSRAEALLLALLTLVFWLILYGFYAVIDRQYYVRYSIFLAAGLCLLIAFSIEALLARRRLHGPVAFLLAAYCLAAAGHHILTRPHRVDWRAAARELVIRAAPSDRILIDPYNINSLAYYLNRFEWQGAAPLDATRNQPQPGGHYWLVNRVYPPDQSQRLHGLLIEPFGEKPDEVEIWKRLEEDGERLILKPGEVPQNLLGGGWSQPEDWGADFSVRWATHERAWLYLPLIPKDPVLLKVVLMPYNQPDAPPQAVRLIVNGHPFERIPLVADEFSIPTWTIPPEMLNLDLALIELRFDWAGSPAAEKNEWDFRALAAAVHAIMWEPAEGD